MCLQHSAIAWRAIPFEGGRGLSGQQSGPARRLPVPVRSPPPPQPPAAAVDMGQCKHFTAVKGRNKDRQGEAQGARAVPSKTKLVSGRSTCLPAGRPTVRSFVGRPGMRDSAGRSLGPPARAAETRTCTTVRKKKEMQKKQRRSCRGRGRGSQSKQDQTRR